MECAQRLLIFCSPRLGEDPDTTEPISWELTGEKPNASVVWTVILERNLTSRIVTCHTGEEPYTRGVGLEGMSY